MIEALALAGVAQVSLLLSGLLTCWLAVPRRVIGVLAGFGAGALIAAVAFDLVAEAEALAGSQFALWMLIGVAVFLLGDSYVERKFGDEGVGGSMGIVVGSVVDGVPESIIFGVQLATGFPVSPAFVSAVFVSNIPQAIAPSADLVEAGWKMRRIAVLWGCVVVACIVASGLGFAAANAFSAVNGDRMAALAAGGLLAMLTNSLIPFAYERAGRLAGVATAAGFCVSMLGS